MHLARGEAELLALQRSLIEKKGQWSTLVALAVSLAGDVSAEVAELQRDFDELSGLAQHVLAGGVFRNQRVAFVWFDDDGMVGGAGISAMVQLRRIRGLGMDAPK